VLMEDRVTGEMRVHDCFMDGMLRRYAGGVC
jgi:hypothetical protein